MGRETKGEEVSACHRGSLECNHLGNRRRSLSLQKGNRFFLCGGFFFFVFFLCGDFAHRIIMFLHVVLGMILIVSYLSLDCISPEFWSKAACVLRWLFGLNRVHVSVDFFCSF